MSEDLVDPYKKIREECISKCPHEKLMYDQCVSRIKAIGEGDCEAWYFELHACVDKFAGKKIFEQTKE